MCVILVHLFSPQEIDTYVFFHLYELAVQVFKGVYLSSEACTVCFNNLYHHLLITVI